MSDQEQLQQEIAQFQQFKEQVQVLATHAGQMEFQLKETDHTIDELGNTSEGTPVYRSAGGVLIRVEDRDALVKELETNKETMDIRLKSLRRQEEELKKKLRELEADLTRKIQILQAGQGMGPPGMSG